MRRPDRPPHSPDLNAFALYCCAAVYLCIVGYVLFTIAVLAFSSPAQSHEFYEWRCCSDRDCGPLPNAAVKATSRGWLILSNNWTIPYDDGRIRQSPDGQFHGCFRNGDPSGDLICLYVPGQGS